MPSRIILCAALVAVSAAAKAETHPLGLGRAPSADELAALDIDARGDGAGLPPGRGTVTDGEAIYAQSCAACHGANGQNPISPSIRLTGGKGTLTTPTAVQTVGSYWPFATTLYDYIHRAMPFNAPQSLAPDQVYAVTAYVLHLNGILPADASLDAASLPNVKMPNRAGFVRAYPADH